MQTFLPYPDFALSAKVLDNKRLGKQRIEARQILEINLIKKDNQCWQCPSCGKYYYFYPERECTKCGYYEGNLCFLFLDERDNIKLAWENHPAILMWRGYEKLLSYYGMTICHEWRNRGFRDNQIDFFEDIYIKEFENEKIPDWLGNSKLHLSHQSNLLRKNWDYYIKYFGKNIQDTTLPYFWPVKKELVKNV